jgi:hypothetical protein
MTKPSEHKGRKHIAKRKTSKSTISKCNGKIRESGNIETHNTKIHDLSMSLLHMNMKII